MIESLSLGEWYTMYFVLSINIPFTSWRELAEWRSQQKVFFVVRTGERGPGEESTYFISCKMNVLSKGEMKLSIRFITRFHYSHDYESNDSKASSETIEFKWLYVRSERLALKLFKKFQTLQIRWRFEGKERKTLHRFSWHTKSR